MSFIRSKNIKGHTYYYLVSNHRINGKVVQKFEKYIGKNHEEQQLIKKTSNSKKIE